LYLQARKCDDENFSERAMNETKVIIMATTQRPGWGERLPLLQRVSVEEDHREHYPNHAVRSDVNMTFAGQG